MNTKKKKNTVDKKQVDEYACYFWNTCQNQREEQLNKKKKKEKEWHHEAGDRATFILSVSLDLRGRFWWGLET